MLWLSLSHTASCLFCDISVILVISVIFDALLHTGILHINKLKKPLHTDRYVMPWPIFGSMFSFLSSFRCGLIFRVGLVFFFF